MAGYERAAIVADDDEQFDTKALFRLAGWGLGAAISLVFMVFAARTDLGNLRIHAALKAIAATPEEQQSVVSAQLLARTANAEREAHRAAETVLALSSDRERMVGRVASAEQEIAELSSSVQRALTMASDNQLASPSLSIASASLLLQPKNPSTATWNNAAAAGGTPQHVAEAPTAKMASAPEPAPEPPALQNVPLPRPAPVNVASIATPPQNAIQTPAAPAPMAVPASAAPQAAKVEEPVPQVTGSIGASANDAAANSEAMPKVEFGVDLGPALTITKLRARWNKLASERPDLVKGMRPLITVRDTLPGKPVEVRLVAGPLANVNAATEFCVTLASPNYVCRPSVFDGQHLAVQ